MYVKYAFGSHLNILSDGSNSYSLPVVVGLRYFRSKVQHDECSRLRKVFAAFKEFLRGKMRSNTQVELQAEYL